MSTLDQHSQHPADDSDLKRIFALLEEEQVSMRTGFESDLRVSLATLLEPVPSSQRLTFGSRIRRWLSVRQHLTARPMMAAAAIALVLMVLVGGVLGVQMFTVGDGMHYATLNLETGSASVTRGVHIFGQFDLTRRLTVAAGESMQVLQGDTVESGQDTIATLVLPDKSHMDVGSWTELDVTDLQARTETQPLAIAMRLERGTIHSEVEHLQSAADRFEVSTPDLVATVKGTIFSLDVRTAGTLVTTDEGLVQVSYEGRAYDVDAGNELDSSVLVAGETVAVRPKRPLLQTDLLANSEAIDENGREIFYMNTLATPWRIQSLSNVYVRVYVNDELYTRVPTDARGLAVGEFSPPNEGQYRIHAVTEMSTSETSLPSPQHTIIVDRTPPFLELLQPTDPQVTVEQVVVSGHTEPQTQLELNGVYLPVDGTGYFEHTLDLVSGTNKFEIMVTDRAGNSMRSVSVIVYE